MKQRELNSLVKKFQKMLKLDWKITVRIVKEVETPGALADTDWEPEWKTARIDILSPEAHEEYDIPFEQNLIHEMLHILFEGHKVVEGPYDPPMEFAINTTAELIYRGLKNAEERTT